MKPNPKAGDAGMMGLGNSARLRSLVLALTAVAGWSVLSGTDASAQGYPGAQAEATGDTSPDPYSFPNIKLCCERKRDKGHHHHHGGWQTPTGGGGDPASITVNCAVPTNKYSVSSIREALEIMRGRPGRIAVDPSAPCDVSGVTFHSGVVVTTLNLGYGNWRHARLTGGVCAAVSAAGPNGSFTLGGIDIEACLAVHSGEAVLDEVNSAWRGAGAAITVNGGSLSMSRSTVRARDAALNATSAGRVWIDDSKLATIPDADYVAKIAAMNINLKASLFKGGVTGLQIEAAQESLQLTNVSVVRSEPDDPYPSGKEGRFGILIGGGPIANDLPWLSGMDVKRASIHGGLIAGYATGLTVQGGSRVNVTGVTINGGETGILAESGAQLELVSNRINGTRKTAIYLTPGVRGGADGNVLHCARGDCVCYGDDCSSRRNDSFGHRQFEMTNTVCDD